MRADDVMPVQILRHGAYICLDTSAHAEALASADVPGLAGRLGLANEFGSMGGNPPAAIAYLKHARSVPGQITDLGLLTAGAVVHVAAATPEPVADFLAGFASLLPGLSPRILAGVMPMPVYSSAQMFNYAYAHRVLQQPAAVMPNALLIPMSKARQWWEKDWLERHTYFLPRYDDDGRMRSQGHALAGEPGIACLLRRTYKSQELPAGAGDYDFVNYFECSDADVSVLESVCAALRDVSRNPEWKYVREGPTWHGRRTGTWQELFAAQR